MPDEPKPNEEVQPEDIEADAPKPTTGTSDMPEQQFTQEELDALKVEQESTPEPEFNERAEVTEQVPDTPDAMAEDEAPQSGESDTAEGDSTASDMVDALRDSDSETATAAGNDTADSESTPPSAMAIQPKKRSKKGLVIGLAVGIGGLLLLGAGAAAYTLWYQNPQKVVADAMVNMIKADTIAVTSDITMDMKEQAEPSASLTPKVDNLTIKMTGATNYTSGNMDVALQFGMGGEQYDITVGGQIDDAGTIHVRIDDLKQKIEESLKQQGSALDQLPAAAQTIVDKLDGNWLRIGTEDIRAFDEENAKEYKEQHKCVTDAYKSFRESSEQQQEVIDVYREHNILSDIVKIGSKDGNLGYRVTIDEEKSDKANEAMEATSVMKAINACVEDEDDNSDSDSSSNFVTEDKDDDKTEFTTTLWISRFGHELKHVEVAGSDDKATTDAAIGLTYDEPFSISKPQNETTLKELKPDIEQLMQQLFTPTAL